MSVSSQPWTLKFLALYTVIILCTFASFYHWGIGRGIATFHTTISKFEEPKNTTDKGIPKKIWYKLGPSGLSNETREWTDTCINGNPGYHAEFLTDESADEYVRKAFAEREDIVENYLGLSVPILKADLLRYLLLWDQGGIWSDLDVSCEEVPMDEWIPEEYKDAGLVVGWEFDVGWEWTFVRQFASWTMMAKPRLPHMMQVIEDIIEETQKIMDEHKVSIGNITLNMTGDVVDFSGPRRLTKGVFKSLERSLNTSINTTEISEILEPRLVGDVLIMPGRSFSASANTYKPEQEDQLPPQLVEHHYAGSWKNDQGGEAGQDTEENATADSSP